MSSAIGGIASLGTSVGVPTQSVNQQTAAKDLAQLILDISAGDTKAAQDDLATLSKDLGSNAASPSNTSPLGKLLSELTTDLGSSDIGAAQKDVQSFLGRLESSAAHSTRHHAVTDTADLSTTSTTPKLDSASVDSTTLSEYLATLLQNLQASGTSPSGGAGAA